MRTGVVAIVLAAGKSSRFGGAKQLEKVGKKALLERTLTAVRRSSVDKIVLVLGHEANRILDRIDTDGLRVVINRRYDAGLSSSVRAGMGEIPDARAVVLVLADQPFQSAATINRLIETYRRSGRHIVAPTLRGAQRNPVLFDRSLFWELMSLSGDAGAKPIILRHPDEVLSLEVSDPRQFLDIDTRADLERAKPQRRRKITPRRPVRTQAKDTPGSGRPS